MKSENMFSYKNKEGIRKGAFNVYQGKNGAIYLLMGISCTQLTGEQVNELKIDLYSIIDFDHDNYLNFYKVK